MMVGNRLFASLLVVWVLLGATQCISASLQSGDAGSAALGTVNFPTSCAAAAQKTVEHGVALLHSFQYQQVEQTFSQSAREDPHCAMAYWGEAMTFNHPVWNQQNRHAALAALEKLGPTSADRLAKAPTQREKDYLQTLDVLYGDGPKQPRDQHSFFGQQLDRCP